MSLDLDDIGGARELALRRLEVAEENLNDAIINFNQGHYRTSNNRAYYAIFRAASACLALEFKSFKQHGQVWQILIKIMCIQVSFQRKSAENKQGTRDKTCQRLR